MVRRETIWDPEAKARVVARIRALRSDAPRGWGTMNAPQMIAHLSDQMRHTLARTPVAARPGILRNPLVRWASIYLVPWPKGRVKGPPEAFSTPPAEWNDDVDALVVLLDEFTARDIADSWPEHALFGRMSGKDWGAFIYKHFDHHLRQFGG